MHCIICGNPHNTHFNNKHKEWWCNKCSSEINSAFSLESEGWMGGAASHHSHPSVERGHKVVTDSRKEFDNDD